MCKARRAFIHDVHLCTRVDSLFGDSLHVTIQLRKACTCVWLLDAKQTAPRRIYSEACTPDSFSLEAVWYGIIHSLCKQAEAAQGGQAQATHIPNDPPPEQIGPWLYQGGSDSLVRFPAPCGSHVSNSSSSNSSSSSGSGCRSSSNAGEMESNAGYSKKRSGIGEGGTGVAACSKEGGRGGDALDAKHQIVVNEDVLCKARDFAFQTLGLQLGKYVCKCERQVSHRTAMVLRTTC